MPDITHNDFPTFSSSVPGVGTYTGAAPFKFWCYKVLPLVYDDSISYYDVLCKYMKYAQDLSNDVDLMATKLEEYNTFMGAMQTALNNLIGDFNAIVTEQNNKINEIWNNIVIATYDEALEQISFTRA